MSASQYVNDFLTPVNYHNAVMDYLEGSTFPQLLDVIENEIVFSYRLDDTEREQLHEVLHSPEFETAFKSSWSDDIEEEFEEYDGTVDEFVADLEWGGI